MDRTTKSLSEPGIGSRLAWTRNPDCSIGRPEGWSSESIANRRCDRKETGDGQDDSDAGDPVERSDEQSGSVGQGSDIVLARDCLRLLLGDVSSEQSTPGGRVPPETVPHEREEEERTRIQGGRNIRIRLLDVIRDQGCVEYREDDEKQQDAAEEHEPPIDLPDVVEHVLMIHPHDEVVDKSRDEGEECELLLHHSVR